MNDLIEVLKVDSDTALQIAKMFLVKEYIGLALGVIIAIGGCFLIKHLIKEMSK